MPRFICPSNIFAIVLLLSMYCQKVIACDANAATVVVENNNICTNQMLLVNNTGSDLDGYNYHYLVADETGVIYYFTPYNSLSFNDLSTGNYCVYGLSYQSSNPYNSAVTHIDDLLLSEGCFALSDCVEVEHLSPMNVMLSSPPICNADGGFSFGVTITGSGGLYIVHGEGLLTLVVSEGQETMFTTAVDGPHNLIVEDAAYECQNEPILINNICSEVTDGPCPSFINTYANPSNICDGWATTLVADIQNDDEGTLTWYNASTNAVVENPEHVFFNTESCSPVLVDFYAVYEPTDTCAAIQSSIVTVTIHPSLNPTIIEEDCSVTVLPNCANFELTWEDNLGNTGIGTLYEISEGTTGTVAFTANDPNAIPENQVCVDAFIVSLGFACNVDEETTPTDNTDACPSINNPMATPESTCDGWLASFNATVVNDDGGELVWYYADTQTPIEDPDFEIIDLQVCEPSIVTFYAIYYPINNTCESVQSEDVEILVHPSFVPTVENDGTCMVTLVANCDNFDITWTDDLGNTGVGHTYTAQPETIGTVSFQASSPFLLPEGEACVTAFSYTAAYNCNENTDDAENADENTESGNCMPSIGEFPIVLNNTHCNAPGANMLAAISHDPNYALMFVLANENSAIVGNSPIGVFDLTGVAAGQYCLYGVTYNTNNAPSFEVPTIMDMLEQDDACFAASTGCAGITVVNCENQTIYITQGNIATIEVGDNLNIITNPTNGSLDLTMAGVLEYVPNSNFVGADNFTLQYFDSDGGLHELTLSIITLTGNNENETNTDTNTEIEGEANDTNEVECGTVFNELTTTTMSGCATPIVPTLICVNDLVNGIDGSIVDATSTYQCSTTVMGGSCIEYVPLPLMDLLGVDVLEIVYCSTACPDDCTTLLVNMEILSEPCAEVTSEVLTPTESLCELPNTDVCINPTSAANFCVTCLTAQDITISNAESAMYDFTVINNCINIPTQPINGTDVLSFDYCLLNDPTTCLSAYIVINAAYCIPNTPPTAVNDIYNTDGVLMISDVMANDFDVDGDSISVTSYTQAGNGAIDFSEGIFTYVPNTGFEGTDYFTYQICDNSNDCTTAMVTIEVTNVACESFTTVCAEPVTPIQICPQFCALPLTANVNITSATTTFNCTIGLNPETDCFQYTALPLATGTDLIQVIGCDMNTGACDTAYVEVLISDEPCDNVDDTNADSDSQGGIAPIHASPTNNQKLGTLLPNTQNAPFQLLSIYPNPVLNGTTSIYLESHNTNEKLLLGIYNVAGELISEQSYQLLKGQQQIELNLHQYPKGIYMIHLTQGQYQQIYKLVK